MVSAIILAAGAGKRLDSAVSKALVKISGKPLIVYSLEVFNRHPGIDEIIVVTNTGNKKAIEQVTKKFHKVNSVTLGGKRRQDSVVSGLKKISEKSRIVLIHDCARPFIEEKLVSSLISAAKKNLAVVPGVPVKATIKSVKGGKIEKTLNRAALWEIQTPQVFEKELILRAYKKFSGTSVTDDATLVEKMGKPVKIIPGSYKNIKITTAEDILIAEALKREKKWNTGPE